MKGGIKCFSILSIKLKKGCGRPNRSTRETNPNCSTFIEDENIVDKSEKQEQLHKNSK
jgi:hypothetical protein